MTACCAPSPFPPVCASQHPAPHAALATWHTGCAAGCLGGGLVRPTNQLHTCKQARQRIACRESKQCKQACGVCKWWGTGGDRAHTHAMTQAKPTHPHQDAHTRARRQVTMQGLIDCCCLPSTVWRRGSSLLPQQTQTQHVSKGVTAARVWSAAVEGACRSTPRRAPRQPHKNEIRRSRAWPHWASCAPAATNNGGWRGREGRVQAGAQGGTSAITRPSAVASPSLTTSRPFATACFSLPDDAADHRYNTRMNRCRPKDTTTQTAPLPRKPPHMPATLQASLCNLSTGRCSSLPAPQTHRERAREPCATRAHESAARGVHAHTAPTCDNRGTETGPR